MTMTKKEAAEFLGVTIRSIEAYAAKGKLTPGKAKGTRGDITVYDEKELQKLKDERGQITFIERLAPENPNTEKLALARTEPNTALATLIDALQQTKAKPSITDIAHKIVLKLDEASSLTGLPRRVLREAITTGKLKAKIIGRAWRMKRADLDAYVKKL